MPFFLTATGIGWMMFGPSRSGSVRYDRRRSSSYDNYDYDDNQRGIRDRAGEAISKAGDKIQSGASATRERLAESAESTKDAVNRTAADLKETVGRATDSVRGS